MLSSRPSTGPFYFHDDTLELGLAPLDTEATLLVLGSSQGQFLIPNHRFTIPLNGLNALPVVPESCNGRNTPQDKTRIGPRLL